MQKKNHLTTILLILILFAGLSLLLYPAFSDHWNSLHQSQVIVDYSQQIQQLDTEKYDALLADAKAHNETLLGRPNPYLLTEEQKNAYWKALDLSATGVMGYIEIPAIQCTLPIYHGTGDAVLSNAAGHLEWTSLPVGGESTHCALSGHRGLPSAKLFTDLDKMVVGDVFILRVLDEILTYEVDQILIVEPHQTESLLIQQGEDLCTLVTCTPYAINTHRLLVRGHRIENAKEAKVVRVTSDAIQLEPLLVAPVLAAPILLVLLMILLLPKKPKHRNGGDLYPKH